MISIIGSSNIDIVYGVDHFTNPGETQKVNYLHYFFGGKGANQAITCARLSKEETYFCSLVGNDNFGTEYLKKFNTEKILGVEAVNEKTGMAFIEVSNIGENRIVISAGANDLITTERFDIFFDKFNESFSISLIQNEIPKISIKHAINILHKNKKAIIYDPAPKENTCVEELEKIDYLTPNETEFEYLYDKLIGNDNKTLIEKALKFKEQTKVKHLILKNGKNSLLAVDNNEHIIEIAPEEIQAVDTTGAGDVFNGALAVSLSKGKDFENALAFAVKAASLSVTVKGAQNSIPKIDNIQS